MPKIGINITDMLIFSGKAGWQRVRLTTDTTFGYSASTGCRAVAYRFVCPQYLGNAKKFLIAAPVRFALNKLSSHNFNISVTDTLLTTTTAYNTQTLGDDAGRVGTMRATITGAGLVQELLEVPVSNLTPGNDYFVVLSPNEDTTMTAQTNMADCSMFYHPSPSTITIPRNHKLCLGDEILISINRFSNDVGHRITYSFNGETGVVLDGQVEPDSVVWTPPLALGNQAPNAMAGECVLVCETILEDEVIGVTEAAFSLYMPSTKVLPTISSITVKPVSTNEVVSNWQTYVQGYSKVHVTVTASALHGAGLKECVVSIGTIGEYNGFSITSDTIYSSGVIPIRVAVTDSRGQQTFAETQIYVYPYSRPALSNIICHRSDEAGKYNMDGTNYYAKATSSYSSVGGRNACVIEARYKTVGGEYSDVDLLSSDAGSVCGNGLLSPYVTYIAQVTARDALNDTPYTVSIPEERNIFKIKDGGRGIGIGVIPTEDDLLDVGLDARFQAGVRISGEQPKLTFTVGNTVVGEIGSYSDGPTIGNMFIRVYDADGNFKEYTWSAN